MLNDTRQQTITYLHPQLLERIQELVKAGQAKSVSRAIEEAVRQAFVQEKENG